MLEKREYEWKVLRYLNSQEQHTYGGERKFISLDSIEIVEEFYRVEVNFIDYFVSGEVEDRGTYYIMIAEIEGM